MSISRRRLADGTTVYDYGVEGTEVIAVIGRVVSYTAPRGWGA